MEERAQATAGEEEILPGRFACSPDRVRPLCRWLAAGLMLVVVARGASERPDGAELRAEHQDLLRAVRRSAPKTPYVVVDTQDNLLLLRDGHQVWRRAVCATGSGRKLEGRKKWHRWTFDTPKGRFSVRRKVEDPLWIRPTWDFIETGEEIPIFAEDPRRFQRGVLGEYALYFSKDYMIHGTLYEINLGKSITHGCVRVGSEDLGYLYEQVEPGWPVYIY